jgi:uncharacterized protein (TIGR03118 family)
MFRDLHPIVLAAGVALVPVFSGTSVIDSAFPRRRSDARRRPRNPSRNWRPLLDQLEDRQLMATGLVASSSLISPDPVAGVSSTSVVARFTDADKNTDPAQYAASIQWGDGKVSSGTIAADPNGGFDVIGTHTFAQDGTPRVTALISDKDGDAASVSTTNIVAQAPITASGVAVHPNRNGVVSRAVVATFTDPNPDLKDASAFSATINWGDGKVSKGTIVRVRATGGFEVLGSHRYLGSGTFSVSTTVQQGHSAVTSFFTVANRISDGTVAADHVVSNFVNPWGLAANGPGDFWDSNNHSGTSTLFDSLGNGNQVLPMVTIPSPAGGMNTSSPTRVIFNATSAFVVSDGTTSGPAAFIFATEDGTIAGWSPTVATGGSPAPSTHAVLAVDNSAAGAVYKGLTVLNVPSGSSLPAGQYLVASNFHSGKLEVFDQDFHPVTLPAGAFQDPTIPAGFAPFGVQSVGDSLYVTYAKQDDAKHDDVAGPGNGFVDVFSTSGALVRRLGGSGGQLELNSPWGVVQAPPSFGPFSNDILVGNFGDSHISAFDPATGAFLGQLNDAQGHPLALNAGAADPRGLWGLVGFGDLASTSNTVFFTSGFNDEANGLFGTLTAGNVAMATAADSVSVLPMHHG